ncbi:hypothetical protein [Hydrogenophaga sp. BPS33]|uniref:hypothetical protein n=1 Tax=Hydrogenophaga sp. BPS33 TaxID=2651974 RepID=UPI0013200680|nr:hypothetical protein [Hydrogenophaga sp. BPS33]QHE83451.1 hypothetical protein F9K07_00445 [Hydrogenophaga sp. BPS33]
MNDKSCDPAVAQHATIPIQLPDFLAYWWVVGMETLVGSGEVINVAAIVQPANGPSQIRQNIAPAMLISMFGAAGKGVVSIVDETMTDVQKQLDAGVRVEALQMPFGGFDVGEPRECAAHDIDEVFGIAVKLSTGFSESKFGRNKTAT